MSYTPTYMRRFVEKETAKPRKGFQLEQTVDEIFGILLTLAGDIIQSKSLLTEQSSLITAVKSSMEQALALAKRVSDSQGHLQEPTNSTAEFPSDGHAYSWKAPEKGVDNLEPIITVNGSQRTCPEDTALHTKKPMVVPTVHQQTLYEDHSSDLGIPSSIELPLLPPTSEVLVFLQTLGSFPLRLLQNTLSHGCFFLETASTKDLYDIFGSALLFRSKEQLLHLFRWFLGPGSRFIYRTSGITWGGQGGIMAPTPYPAVSTIIDADQHGQGSDFLTVFGVCKQLQTLSARVVDCDTIEINIPSSQPPHITQGNKSSSPTFGGLLNFHSGRLLGDASLTLRLSTHLLIANLVHTSACCTHGPGFPQNKLGQVIQSSTI
ncbi:hypothetical protein AYO21_11883 [Fonsecaea monophora]|uniref:Uncharacterized protein n=1 Tax=Fonsecaea monophora TaxID=254056 RepID=A0A177EPS1_9EURO|nr:hypothetical protein AYO21_11883 [Fonsecaea monophora]OAG33983.1 hypothetical protein AYO21_11883 [Fonsecaea monophora]